MSDWAGYDARELIAESLTLLPDYTEHLNNRTDRRDAKRAVELLRRAERLLATLESQ